MKSTELAQSPVFNLSKRNSYIAKVASLIASTSETNSVG